MRYIVVLLVGALAIYLIAILFLRANPAGLARGVRWTGVVLLGGMAALFFVFGRAVWGLMLATFALALLQRAWRSSPAEDSGNRSRVRTELFDMSLDHDTGAMHGVVREGQFAGRELDALAVSDLTALWTGLERESEDARLLAAYLDRRFPGWRDDGEHDAGARQAPPPDPGGMSAQEAYDILGLEPGAGEAEIHAAHHRLMKRVHPDHGGSSALAARINAAKDVLLKHG